MNKKTKICLNAMVANEARTIRRMLDSCFQYIDYWVIQDNGSTDGTQDIIRDYFKEKGIPGFLYEIEWQYPGWNRDHTLQECLKADHGCDWILRMDADEQLVVDDNFDWSVLEDTSIDSFNITAQAMGTKYYRTWLWNAKRPWFFQHDKRHETIHLPEIGEEFQRVTMPYGFRHLITNDGQTWFAPRKFLRDALELEIDKVVGNTVNEDLYHLWYVGKSYADCYGNPDELPFGKDHSDEYARRAIFYFNKFLEINHNWFNTKKPARLDEMSYLTFILLAEAYNFRGEFDLAEEHYKSAYEFSPTRNEHLMYLAFFYERQQKHKEALETVEKIINEGKKNPFPELCFLIEDRCYTDSSNFMYEFRDKLVNKINKPILSSDSVVFDFL
jgi:glycosyltransferase involved in cell wall biosynthesis